jgi:ABC-type transport system substrate-binding protein
VNQTHGIEGITNLLYSPGAPLPERNYRAPNSNINRGAYVNPEYDALMDRFKSTIRTSDRIQLAAQLVQWQTDLQLVTGLVFATNAIMMSNRLQNALPGTTWNVHQWDASE